MSKSELISAMNLYLGNMNRPEYAALPETYISALVWNRYAIASKDDAGARRKPAIVYRKRRGKSSKLEFYETDPIKGSMENWVKALNNSDIEVDDDDQHLGTATAKAICGIYVTEATSQAAVPVTPNIALLQDRFGMMSKQNPADIGMITEQLFAIGQVSDSPHPSKTAADLWVIANEYRMQHDSLLKGLNDAATVLFPFPVISREQHFGQLKPVDFGNWDRTPFHWFLDSWKKLTSEQWVLALPARVWVDWATTVLRLAYGLGFLYESLWFEQIARKILAGEDMRMQTLLRGIDEVLPWAPRNAPQSIRNVAAQINRPVKRAQSARKEIVNWLNQNPIEKLTYDEATKLMKSDADLKSRLELALKSRSENSKNTTEAIRYSLLTRETVGENADLYGLLRSVGPSKRVIIVDPAPDWITVVASLCCPKPGTSVALGQIQKSLHQMGLKPTRDDLVSLLERAGMSRGSADADQGLLVQSAY